MNDFCLLPFIILNCHLTWNVNSVLFFYQQNKHEIIVLFPEILLIMKLGEKLKLTGTKGKINLKWL